MAHVRACLIGLTVPLLVLSACGSSSKSAKPADPATDLATANAAVVNTADLPGYASSPHSNSEDPPSALKSEFASCVKEPTTILDDPPGAQKANSADFTKEPTQISGTVVIAPTTGAIDSGWDSISKSGIESCFETFFREAVKIGLTESQGIVFGPTAVERFDPGIGNRSVGYAVKITANGPGGAAAFFSDFFFVVHDRALMELGFTNTGAALDRDFETGIAHKVYDRLGDKAA
jgi:hypothetical protein